MVTKNRFNISVLAITAEHIIDKILPQEGIHKIILEPTFA